ncbi:phage distal tail protein, Rcc01695 family [Antarcticirhabdus aurantiaca]|uniref:phage distal tail protein, Rcc01695 family n=1 Tax=Antarcticirhabdus aurantiaca TaxID=2606717 RepID=UPI00131BA8BD
MGIASFSDERFPLAVAFGASGGPERRTEIVRLSSGHEVRNGRHRHSWRRFDAASGVRSLSDLRAVVEFFEARRGRLVAFRFRDPLDWRSSGEGRLATPTDQPIGVGDGARHTFQLAKTYGAGADAYVRPIGKPVPGTVQVAVDGVDLMGSGFAVDARTGVVTLDLAPKAGAAVTAGFEFDVPVRFDTDAIQVSVQAFEAGEIPSIPLVEVRP